MKAIFKISRSEAVYSFLGIATILLALLLAWGLYHLINNTFQIFEDTSRDNIAQASVAVFWFVGLAYISRKQGVKRAYLLALSSMTYTLCGAALIIAFSFSTQNYFPLSGPYVGLGALTVIAAVVSAMIFAAHLIALRLHGAHRSLQLLAGSVLLTILIVLFSNYLGSISDYPCSDTGWRFVSVHNTNGLGDCPD